MARRAQKPARPPPPRSPRPGSKKNPSRLLDCFEELWRSCPPLHPQQRIHQRAQTLALSSLLCLGRHTLTGLLSTSAQQFEDWSAAYRLFSQQRLEPEALFAGVRQSAAALVPESQPLCVALDDSLFPRSGTHIHGVAWRRDPLGPRFQTNLIRAQRFVQFSLAVPAAEHDEAVRMIPIDFLHCPTPTRPGPKASEEERQKYRQDSRTRSLTAQASSRLTSLCASLPADTQGRRRPVHVLVDGGYTNAAVLKHRPPNCVFIGRIRKDARLYWQPEPPAAGQRGRRALYGAPAPTPEQVRTSEAYPWETVRVFAAGAGHECRVKIVSPLLWRTAGAQASAQARRHRAAGLPPARRLQTAVPPAGVSHL